MQGQATKNGRDIKSVTSVGTGSFVLPGFPGTYRMCASEDPNCEGREVFACDSGQPLGQRLLLGGTVRPQRLGLLSGGQSRPTRGCKSCYAGPAGRVFSSFRGGSVTQRSVAGRSAQLILSAPQVWKGHKAWRNPSPPLAIPPAHFPSGATVMRVHLRCLSLHCGSSPLRPQSCRMWYG